MTQKLSKEEFLELHEALASKKITYSEYLNRLLSCDLSDIPFEYWKNSDIRFNYYDVIDFSKTHANIDFGILHFSGEANFKGCNVRNLEKIRDGIKPEYFDEKTVKENSHIFLSENIPQNLKDIIYNNGILSIKDICNLSKEQIAELSIKIDKVTKFQSIKWNDSILNSPLYNVIGLEKMVELYNTQKEEYEAVYKILDDYLDWFSYAEVLEEKLKNAKTSEIKKICFDLLRENIITRRNINLCSEKRFVPRLFAIENKDLFLVDKNIPDKVKKSYYDRSLRIDDLIKYYEQLKEIPLDRFIKEEHVIHGFTATYGLGEYQKLVNKYPLVFNCLVNQYYDIEELGWNFDFSYEKPAEQNFLTAIRKYILDNDLIIKQRSVFEDGKIKYKNLPAWIESLGFNYINRLTISNLMSYNDKTFIVSDYKQQEFINIMGIENLKKLQNKTKIFSLNSQDLYQEKNVFKIIQDYVIKVNGYFFQNFKKGTLSYEDFEENFVKLLEKLRQNGAFKGFDGYRKITGEFREKYPEIFIDENAPTELKEAFYSNEITLEVLFENKNHISYLLDKDLLNILKIRTKIVIDDNKLDFLPYCIDKIGKEKTLKLISKYGMLLDKIEIDYKETEHTDEKSLEQALMKSLEKYIIVQNAKPLQRIKYQYLKDVPDFYSNYPELFIDFKNIDGIADDVIRELEKDYYFGNFSYEYIRQFPILIDILKNKNLEIPFGGVGADNRKNNFDYSNKATILVLKDMFGNEKFLELCYKYGRYMDNISAKIQNRVYYKDGKFYYKTLNTVLDFNQVTKLIENIIATLCEQGETLYTDVDAPQFLKEKHPELFLSDDAPEELKKYYYHKQDAIINFKVLKEHKEWLPYLKGKLISPAFILSCSNKFEMQKYFNCFGEEKGLLIGIKKLETVQIMIAARQVYLMEDWYRKTGEKFIPDVVVMLNIPIEEADKFLSNTTNWNKLMKLKEFSEAFESRDAMIKLAYSFGVFDGDKRGFNKLYDLLTKIPKTTNASELNIIKSLEARLNDVFSQFEDEIKDIDLNKKLDYIIDHILNPAYLGRDLIKAIKKDKFDVDFSRSIFYQIYKKNEDGTYTLIINQQNNPNIVKSIRTLFEQQSGTNNIITSATLHQLFGGFKIEYNPEFREFLLNNLDEILYNSEYKTYIAAIQKQFNDIKRATINRKLTLPLAISYVQQNKYEDIEVGNESVAEISSVAGYTQEDFDKLQKIYNYGKQRVFSSIPRIENKTDKYNYEMLRLDDPLAMAIGTLTDCCQELGNVAEVCMEHSMVDKNGRVFVVKDNKGNIVSQSWVWRNKNVLCFDNIEIPNKAFDRVDERNKLAEEVYQIYKKAADELIKKDEEVYKKLLSDGKITKEQYEGLKLNKVTVGIGYNDIKVAIEKNSIKDKKLVRPLPFEELVGLGHDLYTNDSTTQYILEERKNNKEYNGETIQVHNDLYEIYDDNNFTKKELFRLAKLEINQRSYSDITSVLDYTKENFVSEIGSMYDLVKDKTRIILNANFAIIYEENDNKIVIGDLFYNTKAGDMDIENIVLMQIKLAIEQIKNGKEIDIINLEENQKEIYNKAINLKEELDIERGLKK